MTARTITMFRNLFIRTPQTVALPTIPDFEKEGISNPVLISQALRDGPPLSFVVGETGATLTTCMKLCLYHSHEIREILESRQDASDCRIILPHTTVEAVASMITWISFGSIMLDALDTKRAFPAARLNEACGHLWQVWLLAVQLNINDLKSHIIRLLLQVFEKARSGGIPTPISADLILKICAKLKPDTESESASEPEHDIFWESLKEEFMRAIMSGRGSFQVDIWRYTSCATKPMFSNLLMEAIARRFWPKGQSRGAPKRKAEFVKSDGKDQANKAQDNGAKRRRVEEPAVGEGLVDGAHAGLSGIVGNQGA